MAIRFDASADRLARTSGVLDYNGTYTWMAWVRYNSDLNAYGHIFGINRNDAAANYDYIGLNGTGEALISLVDVGGALTEETGSNLTASTWYHICAVRASTTSLAIYLNGTLSTTNTRNVTGRSASTRMEIGGFSTSDFDRTDIRVAAVKIWNTALSAAELAQEIYRITPAQFTGLWLWSPLIGSTTDIGDYSGNARDWTAGGTLTVEDGPPVSWGGRPIWFPFTPASGGTTYNQSVSGSVTPSGAIVKQAARALTGAVTPSGAALKSTSRALAGAFTPAGAIAKQPAKSFTGAFTPAGALVRQPGKALAGSLASAGTLVRQAAKALAGAVTPTGSVTKLTSRSLAGAVTPSGALASIRTVLLSLAGALTPSGALVRQTARSLAGAVTPTGEAIKQTARSVSGGVTPAGTLSSIRAVLLSLAGTLTPSGALARQTNKIAAGQVTPAGAMTKQTARSLAGAVTPTGALAALRTVLVALTGALTPIGTLTRQTAKELTGALAPAGSVVKRLARSLAGALGFAGSLTANISEPEVPSTPRMGGLRGRNYELRARIGRLLSRRDGD